jgi:hypothetical protein
MAPLLPMASPSPAFDDGFLPRSDRGLPIMLRRLTKFKTMVGVGVRGEGEGGDARDGVEKTSDARDASPGMCSRRLGARERVASAFHLTQTSRSDARTLSSRSGS